MRQEHHHWHCLPFAAAEEEIIHNEPSFVQPLTRVARMVAGEAEEAFSVLDVAEVKASLMALDQFQSIKASFGKFDFSFSMTPIGLIAI